MSSKFHVSPSHEKEKKGINKERSKWRWVRKIILWTLIISFALSLFASTTLSGLNVAAAAFLLLLIVFVGVLFDILGTAVTAATDPPFRAMASRRVPSAIYSIQMITNAEKVSNFCNDVIGDISGIISGTTAAVISSTFFNGGTVKDLLLATFLTACVAATTVGGKALGKSFAIKHANDIIFFVSKLLYGLSRIFCLKRKNT